jgi:hypothetical protein
MPLTNQLQPTKGFGSQQGRIDNVGHGQGKAFPRTHSGAACGPLGEQIAIVSTGPAPGLTRCAHGNGVIPVTNIELHAGGGATDHLKFWWLYSAKRTTLASPTIRGGLNCHQGPLTFIGQRREGTLKLHRRELAPLPRRSSISQSRSRAAFHP